MMGWIAYRERKPLRSVALALPVVLGSLYTLPYIFIATFRAQGRFDGLLLGDHQRPSSIDCHGHLSDSAGRGQ